MRNALILKPKDCACLATSVKLELTITVKGRYLYLSTQSSLSKVDWQLKENVVTIPCE